MPNAPETTSGPDGIPTDWKDCPRCGAMCFYPSGQCMRRCGARPGGEQEADLFWDDADTEQSYHDIADIVDNYPMGDIVRVQRALRLHDVFVARIGDETCQFDSLDGAEAWVMSMVSMSDESDADD